MTKVRLYFKFKGTLHRKFYETNVDWEVNLNGLDGDSIFWECEEVLGCLITKGLVDVECCHGVDDFKLLRYELNPVGEAEKTTFGIREF